MVTEHAHRQPRTPRELCGNDNSSVDRPMLPIIPPRSPAPFLSLGINMEPNNAMSYVQMFISDKLNFPPEAVEHPFTAEDLTDLGFIGSGMYGSVRKMRYNKTHTLMAVKRVRIFSNRDNEQQQSNELPRRIQTEVEAIKAASKCAEIVQFYGVTFYEGDCWVCMELMDASLEYIYRAVHHSMDWKFFDETVLGGIAVSTIKALDHLKEDHHIIHRDVKPSNILLNVQGQIKLCDFGISGYLVDSVAQTREVGCRPYMAVRLFMIGMLSDYLIGKAFGFFFSPILSGLS